MFFLGLVIGGAIIGGLCWYRHKLYRQNLLSILNMDEDMTWEDLRTMLRREV